MHCVHFTLMILLQHLLSNASNILLILAVNDHVSQPCRAVLNTVVLRIFIFVGILMTLLLHNLSSAPRVAYAFARRVLISPSLSSLCVRLLPRYVNPSTFSMVFPCTSMFGSLLLPPNIIVYVLPMLMASPYFFASSFTILSECSSSYLFSSRRSTSSANLRLLIRIPCIVIPLCLSLILSIALSRSAMNTVDDIGSPCLVPLVVLNQHADHARGCARPEDVV